MNSGQRALSAFLTSLSWSWPSASAFRNPASSEQVSERLQATMQAEPVGRWPFASDAGRQYPVTSMFCSHANASLGRARRWVRLHAEAGARPWRGRAVRRRAWRGPEAGPSSREAMATNGRQRIAARGDSRRVIHRWHQGTRRVMANASSPAVDNACPALPDAGDLRPPSGPPSCAPFAASLCLQEPTSGFKSRCGNTVWVRVPPPAIDDTRRQATSGRVTFARVARTPAKPTRLPIPREVRQHAPSRVMRSHREREMCAPFCAPFRPRPCPRIDAVARKAGGQAAVAGVTPSPAMRRRSGSCAPCSAPRGPEAVPASG